MTIHAIVATDERLGLGSQGALPWPRNSADMKWFRQNTLDHVVFMGRRTWESIGSKRLPSRINAVATTALKSETTQSTSEYQPDWILEGTMRNMLTTLEDQYSDKTIWVIGGAMIFREALPLVDKLYLTTIPGKYNCDVFLNKRQLTAFDTVEWTETAQDGTIFKILGRSL